MPRDLPHYVATWETGAQFREHVREEGDGKTFYFPMQSDLPTIGTTVSMSLRFLDRDTDFHVHGRVLEHVQGGLRLAFLPEERDRQELVLASAEGESVPYLRRKAIRTACNLTVLVTPEGGETFSSTLSTISERGGHLENQTLRQGQKVQLSIDFPGKPRVHVAGRVTAKIAGPQSGAGIEFLFSASKQRDTFAAEVAAFRSSS
jgi:hypothetical protein